MKKIIRLLICIALLGALSVFFASCGNDESSENPENQADSEKQEENKEQQKENNNSSEVNKENSGADNNVIDNTDVFDDPSFDYVTSDLFEYVYFAEDKYKNYPVSINIARPRPIEVEDSILEILVSQKGEAKNDGAVITTPVNIAPGDTVYIYYRGYTIDENGNRVYESGMTNFASSEAQALSIGSGRFVPGFEVNLVGVNTGDCSEFVKITEGAIDEGQIAYVSYRLTDEDGKSTSASCERIVLSDTALDEGYGIGFRDQILGATIGEQFSFGVTLDGKALSYTLSVDFVTEGETSPIVVECYFPYDYASTIYRNKTAYFEVYIQGVIQYECPDLTDEFVLEYVSRDENTLSYDVLMSFAGDTATEKFRAYIEALLYASYEEEYDRMVEEAMWSYFLENVVIKKYPKNRVDEIYDEYLADVTYQFEQSGGILYDKYTGQYVTYETLDEFAVAYLGLTYSDNKNWKATLYNMSKSLVKERLVLYYLIQAEELVSEDESFAVALEEIKQEYLDSYVDQYLDYEGKRREDYSDEAFAEFVEERKSELFNYYDESYFVETVYYKLALDDFLEWANVTTLDDKVN